MEEDVGWVWKGCPEHAAAWQESSAVEERLIWIERGLDLIAWAIETSASSVTELAAVNEFAALSCYTRAFRSIRACTILALEGLYLEARQHLRDVYESAGLGRMLARRPDKAEAWLFQERWVKDNEVRHYIDSMTMPGGDGGEKSPYKEYYRRACELVHPMPQATLPLAWPSRGEQCHPSLSSRFDGPELEAVLHEIAAQAIFVGFTILKAVPEERWVPAAWRADLFNLSHEVADGMDLSHLERDWEAERRAFEEIQTHVLPADEVKAALESHPNSQVNILRRADQERSRDR